MSAESWKPYAVGFCCGNILGGALGAILFAIGAIRPWWFVFFFGACFVMGFVTWHAIDPEAFRRTSAHPGTSEEEK